MEIENRLSELFGSYKAEWLREKIFDLYTEPSYFPELETPRPCVLVGGRGTGKTTALRSLSYEGQYALKNGVPVDKWPFYGFYYRVNTNRITSFRGPELSAERWQKLFGHYINLLFCEQVLTFLDWYTGLTNVSDPLGEVEYRKVSEALCVGVGVTGRSLLSSIEQGRLKIEAYLNNAGQDDFPRISITGAPLEYLMEALSKTGLFDKKCFFFLIDEYENLLDDQQVVLNTLIKHSGPLHSFKIGVRELGWRKRGTLNQNEQLISPSDYVRINIAERFEDEHFERFASNVCNARISGIYDKGLTPLKVEELLPSISEDREATLLGVETAAKEIKSKLGLTSSHPNYGTVQSLTSLQLFFADFWASKENADLLAVLQSWKEDPSKWGDRYNQYRHAMLFALKRKKSGIRKYYSGWDTFIRLADGNIRYLLELVDQSLIIHLREGGTMDTPMSAEVQTRAAQGVGRKNLSELEGLSVKGAQLTKLLLGLGRIFEVLASNPENHAPELTQFHLQDELAEESEVGELLDAAIMHMALVRRTANRLEIEDRRSYDYAIHPIYAPFFIFSFKKKRKLKLESEVLLSLIKTPRETIRSILKTKGLTDDGPLPEQLALFEGYYGQTS